MTEDYNSISINNTNNNRFKDNLEKSLEESLHNEKLLNKKLEILNQENLQYQSILQNMKLVNTLPSHPYLLNFFFNF